MQLLGRREQSLDRDLMLAALVGVGIGAAGRVEPHHPRRQQGDRIVRPPLHGLGAGLPVGEGDGERRRVAVALQVHPVTADPQRFVDLQVVRPPRVGVEVGARLVVDVGGKGQRLAGRQVVRVEVVDAQADRMQRGAVDGVARPERVECRRRRRAEAGSAVGDDDDVALVAEQLADRHRDEQAEQREVEDDVAELAQIALLGRDLDGRRPRVRVTRRQPVSRSDTVAATASGSPATSAVWCLGSRLRLRGAATGVARRLRTCSSSRGVRQPTSETNSST